ncbi:hypothetical protein D3C72_2549680 [compost metagenome]
MSFFEVYAEWVSSAADIKVTSPVALISMARCASIWLATAVRSRPATAVKSRPALTLEPF